MGLITKIIRHINRLMYISSSDRFIRHLRKCGIEIGTGCSFRPKSTSIDLTRPSLITIGSNCYFNSDFTLLTHDWVSHVFIHSGRDFINSSGKVTIGNNVGFGIKVTVLKGVKIGDNVFIGAGSIVTKDIPSNCVAVGIPCKPIMSLDEYYNKRKECCFDEAREYANSIVERFGRRPLTTDFWEEFPLFVDGDKIIGYPEISDIIKRQLGPTHDSYVKNHKAKFNNFNSFLTAAGIQ